MPYADIRPFYADLSASERCYAKIRYSTAPLERLVALVPPGVRSVVEIGCSAGVFTNLLKTRRPDLDITGVDLDRRKIDTAARTIKGRVGITFAHSDARLYMRSHTPPDAVVCVDVLYLLPPQQQDDLIAETAAWLRPGCFLVIKEMDGSPSWKTRWCEFQEWWAVRVFRITAGAGIHLRPAEEYRAAMALAGLTVKNVDLSRGYPHPHVAWVGAKPV